MLYGSAQRGLLLTALAVFCKTQRINSDRTAIAARIRRAICGDDNTSHL